MRTFSISLSLLFLLALGLLTLFGKLPTIALAAYLVLSLITFVMYWKDKNAARKNERRTPENTLHLLALFGGWPGALIGQQRLRHKTQKVSFRVVLWLTVIGNLAMLTGFLYAIDSLSFLEKLAVQ
ncbi:DUF1294 domain-containing protein [Leucothrix arctica]|uniref:DUF1294 domain-containing protein n=1 Tax=Leucothrix arctica TaxID=1481894 RepID=A0A317CCJ1_9GAMM|nr:DUF1294 domain-containing protein [Leucothrix arctica]PWQ96266.1 DUF1294 domain-containing protein [Leucothrix arctica]